MLLHHLKRLEWASGGRLTPFISCTIALLISVHLGNLLSAGMLTDWGAFSWQAVMSGEVWRLFTGGLLHGGLVHLLFNCLGLGFFGAESERHLGTRGFAALLACAVVLGNLVSGLVFPHTTVIGFSAAVYAALVAFATLYPRAQVIFLIFPMPAWLLVCILVILDLAGYFEGNTGVANLAHLTGAALGFVVIWQLARLRRLLHAPTRLAQAARENHQRANEDEVDRLLEKVSSQGLASLSNAERSFLARYSQGRRGDGT